MKHSKKAAKQVQKNWKDSSTSWLETDYKLNDKFNAPVEEAYKTLRTNIQFCGMDRNRTLAVTSCRPGEGKTTVAMNLAIMTAKSGANVLLIDADLRKPAASKDFCKEDKIGLSSVLAGFNTLKEAVCTTNLSNLFYLPCGTKPLNPTEILNSQKFVELILSVQNDYDAVIIDTPPLGSVIDAAVIASQTDSTIVVIESGADTPENILRVKEQLEKANAKILGAVLNKVKKGLYRDYYNYYDYYGAQKAPKGIGRIFHILDRNSGMEARIKSCTGSKPRTGGIPINPVRS